MVLIDLFCAIDDSCQEFEPRWNQLLLTNQVNQRHRPGRLSLSEIMTIIVWFHHSGYRTFKDFYTKKILIHHRRDFPQLVSYSRFVELMAEVGVSRPTDCFQLSLCRSGQAWKDQCRLVLWVQTPSGGQ